MSTALLIGTPSPALTSLASILHSVDCHLFELPTTGGVGAEHLTQRLKFDLIVTEYGVTEYGAAEYGAPGCTLPGRKDFIVALRSQTWVPLVLIGPELPARQKAQIEAEFEASVCLWVNTPANRKLEALRALLPEVTSTSLRMGALHLNFSEGVARYGQRTLPLTSTEFRLLHSLMQRPGQRIDCDTLGGLLHCQDIPTHIGNLRRKFSGFSASTLLRGNRHQGYAIDARHRQRVTRNAGFALRDHLLHLI